ncbi:DUF1275 family protein [Streptomyces sp. NPDC000880]
MAAVLSLTGPDRTEPNRTGPLVRRSRRCRVLIVLLALGMGAQNAVVRKIAVPDLTTTVLTLTLTGLAADRPGPATVRRLVSVTAMFTGALAGGLLQLHHGTAAALAPALLLLTAVALAAATTPRPGSGVPS